MVNPKYIQAIKLNLPNTLPVFPLDGILLLPKGNLPLNIFEPRYISMLKYAQNNNKLIGMIQTKENDTELNSNINNLKNQILYNKENEN